MQEHLKLKTKQAIASLSSNSTMLTIEYLITLFIFFFRRVYLDIPRYSIYLDIPEYFLLLIFLHLEITPSNRKRGIAQRALVLFIYLLSDDTPHHPQSAVLPLPYLLPTHAFSFHHNTFNVIFNSSMCLSQCPEGFLYGF